MAWGIAPGKVGKKGWRCAECNWQNKASHGWCYKCWKKGPDQPGPAGDDHAAGARATGAWSRGPGRAAAASPSPPWRRSPPAARADKELVGRRLLDVVAEAIRAVAGGGEFQQLLGPHGRKVAQRQGAGPPSA